MIKILSENGNEKYGICHFTVDTQSELQNLPTNVEMGSVCFVISTSENYMLNSNKEWIKINLGGGGSDEPPTIEVSDSGLITATAGSDTVTHQLSAEDNENFIASNIKNGVDIFGTTGTAQTAVVPEVGFVPTAWHSTRGWITEGIWYGANVVSSMFYLPNSTYPYIICYLEHITFDSSTTTIGQQAFSNLRSLSSITFSPNITTIDQYAFSTCTALSNITLPSSLKTIGRNCFSGCSSLSTVTFLGTPNSMNGNEFANCSNLTIINVPWAEGAISGAPWGATNATINYNYTPS